MRATCTHIGAPVVIGASGQIVCAICGAAVLSEHERGDEVSTLRLPTDATADTFNRACRAGRVKGARKGGRVWICTRAAWEARTKAPTPKLSAEARAKVGAKLAAARRGDKPGIAKTAAEFPTVSADLLAEWGAKLA